MQIRVVLASAVLAAVTGTALADVYRYVDSGGEIHYVDDVAKVPKKYRKQLEHARELPDISVTDAAPPSRRSKGAASSSETVSYGDAKVEVYMTSWCGYCKKMVRFLNEKGIAYTAYDIEKDSGAARTYRELGGSGVPLVRVGSHVIHGYNPDAVMSHLNGK